MKSTFGSIVVCVKIVIFTETVLLIENVERFDHGDRSRTEQ